VGDLDRKTGELKVDFSEPGEQFSAALEGFGRTMAPYPLFNWDPTVNDGKPFFRRDFFTARQFRRLDIYAESFSLSGWENHAAVHVPTIDEHTLFIGLERGKGADYTERDRLILTLAQAQLANARILAHSLVNLRESLPPDPAIYTRHGFSRREADVLAWLTEGKSNAEIALLLKIELATVKYHLRSIYNRLGTDNRLAATLFALDIARHNGTASTAPATYRVRMANR
jgi:DNA-binding CsgD family transcriptional regulator